MELLDMVTPGSVSMRIEATRRRTTEAYSRTSKEYDGEVNEDRRENQPGVRRMRNFSTK